LKEGDFLFPNSFGNGGREKGGRVPHRRGKGEGGGVFLLLFLISGRKKGRTRLGKGGLKEKGRDCSIG